MTEEGGQLLEGIPWPVIGDFGPTGLLAIVVLLIITGKLVPKSVLDAETKAKEHWRAACEREQEANRLHARAADAQSVGMDTVVKVMAAVQTHATQGGDDE